MQQSATGGAAETAVGGADTSTMPHLAAPSVGADSPVSTGSASSASATKKNGRKGSRKVRTGCITCKIRRVKCDEGKPSCERCTKTGRKCDGYATPKNGSLSSHTSPTSHAGVARAVSPFAAWDDSEQLAFHYYRNCSATSLFAQATSSFWARVVPALCFEEPAVRHAVLVISSLHQSAYGGTGRPGETLKGCDAVCTPFAAGQYGKALRCLQQWRPPTATVIKGTASVTVPLLACLLFICIEFMLGDPSAAQVHIIQGRVILAKLAEDPREARGPGADLIRRELVPVYTRLSVASFVFGSKPVPIPAELKPLRGAEVEFERLEDAELSLHEIMDDGLRFTKEARSWTFTAAWGSPSWAEEYERWQARKAELTARANEWQVAFAVLLAAQGDGNSDAARMCRLYYLTMTVYMGTALGQTECAFDEYMTTFASMVAVAGEILQAEEERGEAPATNEGARFSFESGIVPPLYFAAIKCRHPGLRRAAIRLLRRKGLVDCKENLWDTRLVARIATRIMEIEEARAARTWGEGVVEASESPEGDAGASLSGRNEIKRFLKHIPMNQPPSIPHEEADWIFETEAASPVPVGDLLDAPEALEDWDGRASPFHVPEAARVMNADVSPRVGGGSWVTFWVMPETEGERHWDVIREFVGRGIKSAVWGVA